MGTSSYDGLVLVPKTIEDIKVYTSPWVSNTRATRYYGPVIKDLRKVRPEDPEKREALVLESFIEIITDLRRAVLEIGGNAVVGLELKVDPFVHGDVIWWEAAGTAAQLKPLL